MASRFFTPFGYKREIRELLPLEVRNESGDSKDSPVAVGIHKTTGIVFLNITEISGADPKLNVSVYTYDSVTNHWYLLKKFKEQTGVSEDTEELKHNLGEKIAVVYTIIGGSFKFQMAVHFTKA